MLMNSFDTSPVHIVQLEYPNGCMDTTADSCVQDVMIFMRDHHMVAPVLYISLVLVTNPLLRNKGYGGDALRAVLETTASTTIVIVQAGEIETVHSVQALLNKLDRFYTRLGFVEINDINTFGDEVCLYVYKNTIGEQLASLVREWRE